MGHHYRAIERVPQPDVSELNLELCSHLSLYIRVERVPPPSAQQDVAEDEE